MKIFNLKLSDETHQQLKVKAAIGGITIKELLGRLVDNCLTDTPDLLEALKEAREVIPAIFPEIRAKVQAAIVKADKPG